MLYNLIIAPIEMIVDWVFIFFYKNFMMGAIGAVVGVSFVINFLALPIYNIADGLQAAESKKQKSMEKWVRHIKKSFKGDEQFMMLSEYYRQNDYHPLYVLRSSLSILIEIPFFIAAFHYLSHNSLLSGSGFLIFNDFGSPDRLLKFALGGKLIVINILPIIMTLINFVSGAIYTKDSTLREKTQLYVIALIFLFLLYDSPSGLVLYWILNNLFSLFKNIILKLKHPGRITHILVSLIITGFGYYVFHGGYSDYAKRFYVCFALVIYTLPFIKRLFSRIFDSICNFEYSEKTNLAITVTSGLGLALLAGLLLPSSVIASSPVEFSYLGNTENPISYVYSSLTIFLGLFLFWPFCLYKMFGKGTRKTLPLVFFTTFVSSLLCVYVFKQNYGDLTTTFALEYSIKEVSFAQVILPILAIILTVALYIYLSHKKKANLLVYAVLSVILAEILLGVMKINTINKSFREYETLLNENSSKNIQKDEDKVYNFTKTGKNVVVLFLDRAIGSFVPQIFEENPDIAADFEDFTFYSNAISFSTNTATGIPPILGGYEYTPDKINKRKNELLREKHNEATLVMPKLFLDKGYDVTVTDPPLPNYLWKGDFTAFKPYPEIHVQDLTEKYFERFAKENGLVDNNFDDENCRKEIKNFSILQMLPPILRDLFYSRLKADFSDALNVGGVSATEYLAQYSTLYYLSDITAYDNDRNTFTFIENDTPHNSLSLDKDYHLPEYKEGSNRVTNHYDVNAASLKRVGIWLRSLKENGCFDNTRIIIVSDHGKDLDLPAFSSFADPKIPSSFGCMLMFKDFDQKEGGEDKSFMTNADTVALAIKDLDIPYVNPFTGKEFTTEKANGIDVYTCLDWNPNHFRNNKTFNLDENQAYHVHTDIYDPANWTVLSQWKKGGNN
ncbi:MAG: membrane protein insertase YidC [Spirochaetales bacterium]|nr:membrane protein insertase YidC [Spirochaetales bacterium]